MVSGPSWWFNKEQIIGHYTKTLTKTAHGEHTRYFIGGKRVAEGEYWNRFKGALFRNQVRGWAANAGVTDWNQAQSKFAQIRKDYADAVKARKDYEKSKGWKDPFTADKSDLEAIWEQIAYEQGPELGPY